jgi:hypothetical protein
LGQWVRHILEFHVAGISFIPETAYAEAEHHLPAGGEHEKVLCLLRSLAALGTVMTHDIYAELETGARKRLTSRRGRLADSGCSFGGGLSDLDGRR